MSQGVKRFDARQLIVDALVEKGLFRGKKTHPMTLPVCRLVFRPSVCVSFSSFFFTTRRLKAAAWHVPSLRSGTWNKLSLGEGEAKSTSTNESSNAPIKRLE